MPPYYDVYVLARERSASAAEHFLNTFVPDRVQSAVDYVFPQSGEPSLAIGSAEAAIQYCEAHPLEAQSFYFRNVGIEPDHAMLFFTPDGGLILGLSVVGHEDEWFARLKEHAGSKVGYITFESPPAITATEFKQAAENVA